MMYDIGNYRKNGEQRIVAANSVMDMRIGKLGVNDLSKAQEFYKKANYKIEISETDFLIGAFANGELVGLGRVSQEDGCLVLRRMQVREDFRKQGIGSRILKKLVHRFEGDNCYCIPYTHLENWYARVGFEQVKTGPEFLMDRLKAYQEDGNEVSLMRWNPESLKIEKATASDAKNIYENELCYAQKSGYLVSRPEDLKLENYERLINQLSNENDGIYLKAAVNGMYAGHAFLDRMSLSSIRHVARLTLVVKPEFRSLGIGSKLLHKLIRWASDQKDLFKLELQVRALNTPAIDLYQSVGFKKEGVFEKRIRTPDGNFIDEVAMGMTL